MSNKKTKSKGLIEKIAQSFLHYIPIVSIAAIIIVLPSTKSRAAWLAVLVSAVVLGFYEYNIIYKVYSWKLYKKVVFALILPIVFFSGLYGLYHFKKSSADGRILIWKVTTQIIDENLAFGVGYDRFKAHYMNYQAKYFIENEGTTETILADNTIYAFNEVLQFLTENGIIGILIVAIILFVAIRLKVEKKNVFLRVVSLGGLVSIFIFGLFSYPSQILPIKMLGILLLALLAKIDVERQQIISKRFEKMFAGHGISLIRCSSLSCCVILIGIMCFRIIAIDSDFRKWRMAMFTYNNGLYTDSIDEFKAISPMLHTSGNFLMTYGKALIMNEQAKNAIEILETSKRYHNNTIIETSLGDSYKKNDEYKNAERSYQHAANMVPVRLYPHYLMAKLYEDSGEMEKAVKKAKEVIEKKTKISSKAVDEMRLEMSELIANYKNTKRGIIQQEEKSSRNKK